MTQNLRVNDVRVQRSATRTPRAALAAAVLCSALLVTWFVAGFGQAGAQTTEDPWQQLGNDIEGEAASDGFGTSVAVSADGNTVIVGASSNDGSAVDAGHARVLRWNGRSWFQLGSDIDGEAADDAFGQAVAISADGQTVVIGASGNDAGGQAAGHARVLRFDGSDWVQVGLDIDGQSAGHRLGFSVDISADGQVVALGGPGFGDQLGRVRVLIWSGRSWLQLGSDLLSPNSGVGFGWSLSLSADGETLAVGSPSAFTTGSVVLFDWDARRGIWTSFSDQLVGRQNFDAVGWAVDLSADGQTLISGAVGVDDGNGEAAVFRREGLTLVPVGQVLTSDAGGEFGVSVGISADGDTVVVGAHIGVPRAGATGQALVFEFDGRVWTQVLAVDAEQVEDRLGAAAAISDDGNTVAVGAHRFFLSGVGEVEVYRASAAIQTCAGLVVTVDIGAGQLPTTGDDVILGTPGNDIINGFAGSDTICGGQGDDILIGADGADFIFGGAGDDLVQGNNGNDFLVGGNGADRIIGENGNDRIFGGGGNDILNGDNGADRIAGGPGNDRLFGGDGADRLFGNVGLDQLNGDAGNDVLRGGLARDTFNGGAGINDGCTLTDPNGVIESRINCEGGVFGR